MRDILFLLTLLSDRCLTNGRAGLEASVTCSGSQSLLGLETGIDLGLSTSRATVISWADWPFFKAGDPVILTIKQMN